MNHKTMEAAFNEWMRRYTESPEEFEHEWQSVEKYLSEFQPTYGAICTEYLFRLAAELAAP